MRKRIVTIVIIVLIPITVVVPIVFTSTSISLQRVLPDDGIDLDLILVSSDNETLSYCYVGQGPGDEHRELGDPRILRQALSLREPGIILAGIPHSYGTSDNAAYGWSRYESGSLNSPARAVTFYGSDENGEIHLHISKKTAISAMSYFLIIRARCEGGELTGSQSIGVRALGVMNSERSYRIEMSPVDGSPRASDSNDWMMTSIENSTPRYGSMGDGIGYSSSVQ